MTNTPHALDALAADFRRHGQWLQRLANGLVLDASEADDLLQEAWLAAAGAGHRPTQPGRTWFAGVLRNVARTARRSAGRRRQRESRAVAQQLERSALAATSDERVAREQHLLALVATLPEPQRDAVVARFFDDLSPTAIARRDGLSVDAVKSRLKRGLEALRARIEQEQNGLHGLALWLAPLARGRKVELVSSGALLAAGGVAAAALVGVATYGAWAPARLGGVPAGTALARTTSPTEPAAGSLVAVSPPASRKDRMPVEVVASQERTSKECRIHGRIVDIDGAPVHGARVVAHGRRSNSDRVEAYGLPTQWQDPEVLTDENGAFELRFVPPQAFQFTVKILHDEFADLGWRWSRIHEGEERNQGTVVLPKPAVLEGHVEGARGELLVGSWHVEASLSDQVPEHQGVSTKSVALDPATGSFRFDDLPPAQIRIEAIHTRGDRAESRLITTATEKVTRVVLRYEGPDPSTTIRLTIASDGLTGQAASQLADGAVRAFSEDGEMYPFEPTTKRGRTYTTGALPPGSYHVEVEDERFVTWSQDGVRPGEKVRVQLAGRAKLRLTLLDPEGVSVPRYRLGVRLTEPVRDWNVVELLSAGAPPPESGTFEGLLPGAVEVTIEVEGYPEWRGEVRGLEDDAVVDLRVQLSRPRPLAGRVVHADGRPATNGTIEVTRGRVAGHGEPGMRMTSTVELDGEMRSVDVPYRDAAAELAEDGSFDLGPIGGPRAVLRVRVGDWLAHDMDVALEGLELPLLVTLPPSGAIEGRVLFDGERPQGDLQVLLWRDGAARPITDVPCHVDDRGRFMLGPVQPGAYVVFLVAVQEANPEQANAGAVVQKKGLVRRLVHVAPGAPTKCELDLGHPRSAGIVTVSVTFAGVPATPGTTVRLNPMGRFDTLGYPLDSTTAATDGGSARFERVAPSAYRVSVAGEPHWVRSRDAEVQVTGGGVTQVDFDVDVVHRTLRVVDAQGEVAANRKVGLCPPGSVNWLSPFTTDAAGKLQLAIPAGAYSLSGSIPDDASLLGNLPLRNFDWERGEGALIVVLPDGGAN
jgi:RNA polymerase sigma factor (sigma-70 family)